MSPKPSPAKRWLCIAFTIYGVLFLVAVIASVPNAGRIPWYFGALIGVGCSLVGANIAFFAEDASENTQKQMRGSWMYRNDPTASWRYSANAYRICGGLFVLLGLLITFTNVGLR